MRRSGAFALLTVSSVRSIGTSEFSPARGLLFELGSCGAGGGVIASRPHISQRASRTPSTPASTTSCFLPAPTVLAGDFEDLAAILNLLAMVVSSFSLYYAFFFGRKSSQQYLFHFYCFYLFLFLFLSLYRPMLCPLSIPAHRHALGWACGQTPSRARWF